jgi:exopolysaccharide production protein ExoY
MIRIFDIMFSILVITLGLPIFMFISLIIIFQDGFPIFFKQNRVGKKGVLFKIFKFRSMKKNAEEILLNDKKLYQKYLENDFKINANEDPRILPFGLFLRKTSLDEIPQFINVLIGDMSIVGPRPVVEKELDELYKENSKYYISTKPGITGLWQVSGRSNIKGDERVKLDIQTIEKKSIFFNINIVFKTIVEVIKKRGAF